ncbi:Hypothetical protein SCF082_LOCUS17535, partial [Durusdinium trenchii]
KGECDFQLFNSPFFSTPGVLAENMIHVFRGCGQICSLPAKACNACNECCENCGCCQECEKLCSHCGDCIDQPLGLYVAVGMLTSIVELACCVVACKDDFSECLLPEGFARQVGLSGWLKLQMGFAWLNMIFPPYLQHRLMQTLSHRAGTRTEVSQKEVKESFQEVFWEDFGVCLYVFAWAASLVWSILGVYWQRSCHATGWVDAAALLGITFFWGSLCYGFAWFCYISCMSTMPVQWALRVHEVSGQLRGRPSKGQPLQQIEAEAFPRPVSPGSGCAKACTVGQLAKLMACIGLDVFGDATYLMPGVGETADLGYAPLQGIALQMLFRSYSISGIGFLEELLPFTDFVPTATIAWMIDTFFPDTLLGRALGLSHRTDGSDDSSGSE